MPRVDVQGSVRLTRSAKNPIPALVAITPGKGPDYTAPTDYGVIIFDSVH